MANAAHKARLAPVSRLDNSPLAFPDAHTVIDSLPDAILILNRHEGFVYANLAAEELLLKSAKVIQQNDPAQLFVNGRDTMASLHDILDAQIGASLDCVIAGKMPGDDSPAKIYANPLAGDQDHLIIKLMVLSDRMKNGPADQPDTRAIEGMAAVLAHEVKNPLSGIRGSAQLLSKGLGENDRRLTDIIMNECDRIRDLIDSMEGFTDPRPAETKATNIHEILDHVIGLAQSGFAQDIEIIREFDPSLPEIMAARDSLVQVFLNLLKNAAEAVEPGRGRITLRTAYRHGAVLQDKASARLIETPIEISVQDNGPGIAPNLLDCLFDPFISGKKAGQGLGLTLSKKIIGDHAGTIRASNSSSGAVFTVNLPLDANRYGRDTGDAP